MFYKRLYSICIFWMAVLCFSVVKMLLLLRSIQDNVVVSSNLCRSKGFLKNTLTKQVSKFDLDSEMHLW